MIILGWRRSVSDQAVPFGEVDNFGRGMAWRSALFVFAGATDVVPPAQPARWQSPPFSAERLARLSLRARRSGHEKVIWRQ
ncbi:MAG: hypothetical protein IPL59_26935 [Candidatus Competibacteraceae bacterium]|nr:hypothetical protein [Candidatus Competibacteraceae bacterium]